VFACCVDISVSPEVPVPIPVVWKFLDFLVPVLILQFFSFGSGETLVDIKVLGIIRALLINPNTLLIYSGIDYY